MKYVILRDDDTNALMPAERLERLYRPFLDRGMPVNLAVIPRVCAAAAYEPGQPERFLAAPNPTGADYVSIGENKALISYLRANPLLRVVQHGCSHESVHGCREFDHEDAAEIARRLDDGARALEKAGLGRSSAFVAPYDRLSRTSLLAAAARFRVISTGWFEWRRLPPAWWPRYVVKKITRAPHWRVGGAALLSHPGCHLSHHRPPEGVLRDIRESIDRRRLTVLVTHWWEYFPHGKENTPFIEALHETAGFLASCRDITVVSFQDIADGNVSLN